MKQEQRLKKMYVGRTFAIVDGPAYWVMFCTGVCVLKDTNSPGLYGYRVSSTNRICEDERFGPYDLSVVDARNVTELFRKRSDGNCEVVSRKRLHAAVDGAEFEAYAEEEPFDTRRHKKQKTFMNDILKAETLKAAQKRNTRALILDGKYHKTTDALRGAGVRDENIVIPNCDAETCAVLNQYLPRVDVRFATVGEYLGGAVRHRFDIVYLDYCGTFRGNIECNPREDMLRLFRRKLLASAVLFAFTFCVRDNRRDKNVKDDELALNYLQEVAIAHRYSVTHLASHHYGSMFSMVFRLAAM